MSKITVFEGVVVKKIPLLENVQSVTVFTREMGKVHFIVKGARKLTSRRSAHLQTGNLIRLQATSHKSATWYIGTTELISGFSNLKESTDRVRVLYNMLLVLDKLLPAEMIEDIIYHRLIQALIHLNGLDSSHDLVLFSFVSDIFALLGYGEKSLETYDDVQQALSKLAEENIRLFI